MAVTRDLYQYVPCNLCGSSDYKVKFHSQKTIEDPKEIFSASGGVMGVDQIVQCTSCGLVYVNPRIKPEIVLGGYAEAKDELYISQAKAREATFKRCLKVVERYASQRGRLLDVGSAAGYFVKVASDSGWDVVGVEPSHWLSEYGRKELGVNVVTTTLKEAAFEDNSFDVITMWDVLEHTPDPLAELQEAYRVLKPGGLIVINYPDIGSGLARLAGAKWWFLLSVHLYYFTRETLSAMLRKTGFTPVRSARHYQLMGLGHLVKMVGLYNRPLSNFGLALVRSLRMENIQIPYYASQVNLMARKGPGGSDA